MMTVEDILMKKGPDVIVAPPQCTVLEAAKLMSEADVGSLIVRRDRQVLGIFTERDLLRRVVAAGKDPCDVTLEQVMSSPVQSCRLSDGINTCAERLTRGHIRHLAVIEQDALVGLISFRDLLVASFRTDADPTDAV